MNHITVAFKEDKTPFESFADRMEQKIKAWMEANNFAKIKLDEPIILSASSDTIREVVYGYELHQGFIVEVVNTKQYYALSDFDTIYGIDDFILALKEGNFTPTMQLMSQDGKISE